MAEKKKDNMTAINFRCSTELKTSLEDLAHLSRSDVSTLLLAMCTKLVDVNKQRITNFRRQAATPIKMPFEDTPDNAPKVDVVIVDGDNHES